MKDSEYWISWNYIYSNMENRAAGPSHTCCKF